MFVDGKECGRELTEVEVEVKKLARYDLVTYKCSRVIAPIFYASRKIESQIFKMLTFHCTDCNETINGGDHD